MVMPSDDDDSYHFDLWYENPKKLSGGGVGGIHIRIQERLDYGTSAYPIMILGCLTEEPKTQKQIIDEIEQRYQCTLERKAVGRHIEMLKMLNHNIQQCKTGYYIPRSLKRLTPAEWRSVMDCVRAYPDINNDFREGLLCKLKTLVDE